MCNHHKSCLFGQFFNPFPRFVALSSDCPNNLEKISSVFLAHQKTCATFASENKALFITHSIHNFLHTYKLVLVINYWFFHYNLFFWFVNTLDSQGMRVQFSQGNGIVQPSFSPAP